jgi:hypothetical protein
VHDSSQGFLALNLRPRNDGVISVQRVGFNNSGEFRRIEPQDPETGARHITKAWATTDTAKRTQNEFLLMTYHLMLGLESQLEPEQGIPVLSSSERFV